MGTPCIVYSVVYSIIYSIVSMMISMMMMISLMMISMTISTMISMIYDGFTIWWHMDGQTHARTRFLKGGSKVWVLGQGGAFNSAPNGANDLKFCMQGGFWGTLCVHVLGQGGVSNSAPDGTNDLKICLQRAYMGYYWVLVKSCDLYRDQLHLVITGLVS